MPVNVAAGGSYIEEQQVAAEAAGPQLDQRPPVVVHPHHEQAIRVSVLLFIYNYNYCYSYYYYDCYYYYLY